LKADLAETGIAIADGQNPILRMPVLVSGDQGTVFIDELVAAAATRCEVICYIYKVQL